MVSVLYFLWDIVKSLKNVVYILVINTIKIVLVLKPYSLNPFLYLKNEKINSSTYKMIRPNKVVDLPVLTELFDKKKNPKRHGFHYKEIYIKKKKSSLILLLALLSTKCSSFELSRLIFCSVYILRFFFFCINSITF